MDNNFIEVIQGCITEYGDTESEKTITLQALQKDFELLEWCCDFVVDLFCEIGLDEKFEPNSTGRELDRCLEFLNSIRYKYHDSN